MDFTLPNLRTAGAGFKANYQQGFAQVSPIHAQVATEVPSTTAANEYGWLGDIPSMREWIGERQINKLSAHGYRIKNRKFELTIGMALDDLSDDNLGIYAPRFKNMGDAVARHPDEIVFETVEKGFTDECFDEQPFFDTDHPVIDKNGEEASASNLLATVGDKAPFYLLDTSRPLKPFILQMREKPVFQTKTDINSDHVFNLDEVLYGVKSRLNVGFGFWQMAFACTDGFDTANFATLYTAMSSQTGDHGKKLTVQPNVLMVPPTYEDAARLLMTNDKLADGNPNPHKGKCTVLVCPWLSTEAL